MYGDAAVKITEAALRAMAHGWNTADGAAYAAPFTDDADFVDIRGAYHTGRAAIAAGHQHIFDTIYQASTVRMFVLRARHVGTGVVQAVCQARQLMPGGPFAGDHTTTFTLVLVVQAMQWRIAALNNTVVAPEVEGIPGHGRS